MDSNEEHEARYVIEVVLSCCFILLAVVAFVFSVLKAFEKDWFSAAYAFAAGNLSLAAGCNPIGAVALMIGKVVVEKSRLGYSDFAIPFLVVAFGGGAVAWMIEHFGRL